MARGSGENVGGFWTVESDGYQFIIKRYVFMKDPDGSIRTTERASDNSYFSDLAHLVKTLRTSRIMDLVNMGEPLLLALEKAQAELMAWLNQHYPAIPQGLEGYPAMMELMKAAQAAEPVAEEGQSSEDPEDPEDEEEDEGAAGDDEED